MNVYVMGVFSLIVAVVLLSTLFSLLRKQDFSSPSSKEYKDSKSMSVLQRIFLGYGTNLNLTKCLALVSLFLFILVGCKDKKVIPPPIVLVESSKVDNVELFGEYVGRLTAFRNVEVRARVDGFIQEMTFEQGKSVTKGDLLYVIDPTVYQAKYEYAKAVLKKSEAEYLKAKRDEARLRPLYKENAVSQLDLDNATAQTEVALANVAMSKATLQEAETELSYTQVRAPISGYISESKVFIGSLVGSKGESLLSEVVQINPMTVDFDMTGLDYLSSKRRNVEFGTTDSTRSWQPTVSISLPDNTTYNHKGLVNFADPQVNPSTGTFSVSADVPNPNRVLLPGQFTQVKLLLDVLENAVVVPRKAVYIEKGGAFIMVVRTDSIVEKRFVQTGVQVNNTMVIDRGLKQGEWIITEGRQKVVPGEKVIPALSTDSLTIDKLRRDDL